MLKKTFPLTIGILLVAICIIKTGTTISEAASSAEPSVPPPEHLSIHQKSSSCWEDFKVHFKDKPHNCQNVCNTCHTVATVIGGEDNPEAYTTDIIFPEPLEEEANWNTIGLLQRTCTICHTDITEAEPGLNHVIFVEYDNFGSEQDSTETDIKLYDGYILCTTCHSPHRDEIALLRVSNQGSALCLGCHDA